MVERLAVQTDVDQALVKLERVKNMLDQVHAFANRERLTALWDATQRGLGELESVAEFLRTRHEASSSHERSF